MDQRVLCRTALGCLACWLSLSAAIPSRADSLPGPCEQIGLFVGTNDAGADLRRLRYAERDAEKLRDAFVELGSMAKEHASLLIRPDLDDLEKAMRDLNRLIRRRQAAGARILLVFSFSGHVEDCGLRLGTECVASERVMRWLERSPAEMRLALIDSRGPRRKNEEEGVRFRLGAGDLQDSSAGRMVMLESSCGDGVLELDELGGSFFVHDLVSGLRGAADVSGDGEVSLRESCEFVSRKISARASSVRAESESCGQLADHGEILLARPGHSPSALVFGRGQAGTYLIYDLDRQRLAAEISKRSDEESRLGLKPGRYIIKKRRRQDLLIGQLSLERDEHLELLDEQLHPVAFGEDLTRGLVVARARDWRAAYSVRFGAETFFDSSTGDDLFYDSWQGGLQVEFLDLLGRGWALALDLLFSAGEADTRLEIDPGFSKDVETGFFRVIFGVAVNYHLDWRRFGLYGGPRLGFLMASRSFAEPFAGRPAQTFGTICPGLSFGVNLHLGDFDVFAEGRMHVLYYNLDGGANHAFGGLYLGLAYRH